MIFIDDDFFFYLSDRDVIELLNFMTSKLCKQLVFCSVFRRKCLPILQATVAFARNFMMTHEC